MLIVTAQDAGPVVDEDAAALVPRNFELTLLGGDGSSWDLVSGPVGLLPGTNVFEAADVGHWWRTSPVADGSRWDGMRTPSRSGVTLAIEVTGSDWQSWRDNDRGLFQAIHPARECSLVVTAPDGTSRSLGLRFVGDSGAMDTDPLAMGNWSTYALEFAAAMPFWRGDPVTIPLPLSAPRGMFRGHTDLTQPGPFLPINASRSDDRVTVTNVGDEPVWPTYTITGPMSSWQVGVGDALVGSQQPLSAGQTVTVDTDPFALNVTDQDGAYVYEYLSRDDFAAIPAGTDVLLHRTVAGINVAAGSQLLAAFTPLNRRPW